MLEIRRPVLNSCFVRIIERLKELGYTADDFPEGEEAWKKLVRQPKPLTDRST